MASNNEIIQAGEELVDSVLEIVDDCYYNIEIGERVKIAVKEYKAKIK